MITKLVKRIKLECWMIAAFGVKVLGIRPQEWYEEHKSRARQIREVLNKQVFDYAAYGHLICRKPEKSKEFVPLAGDAYVRKEGDAKVLAFYLPQFHSFPENDAWHGRGFTEWTNVTRAVPQFVGHHQPQLPIDVGFYDLSHTKVMSRQVELAKQYGVYGFCFHYYWFSGGKRLLEKPIFNWLEHKELDLPFCLCWANENWSKLWDGGNKEVLMKQESRPEDAEPFFHDILPFLKDERYIRIDGKPLLVIYRPALFARADYLVFEATLRRLAKESGLDGLYLAMVGHEYFEGTAKDWNFDAMVEFPPMRMMKHRAYANDIPPLNPEFKGFVYSMREAVESGKIFDIPDEGVPVFRGAFPTWDNTARKAYSNASVYLQDAGLYKKWLKGNIAWENSHNPADKRFVFVNAWNEWAEGAHLEPDARNGYAYLQATRDAIEEGRC